jgi:hypothetical protein
MSCTANDYSIIMLGIMEETGRLYPIVFYFKKDVSVSRAVRIFQERLCAWLVMLILVWITCLSCEMEHFVCTV